MERNDEGIIEKIFSNTGDAALPVTYEAGFIPATSTPGSGVFPKRTDFNFMFKILTALAVDINRCGCLLPWDILVNYYQGARVTGSDGKIYIALVATGPATTNPQNPTIIPTPPAVTVWALAFGTMAAQNANAIAATGGAMDGVTIGLTTPAEGNFTTATDGGAAPTLPSQLTNKAYVDSKIALKTGMGSAFWGTVSSVPAGFIPWVDGTIGSSASSATIRANADTQNLYTLLWNSASDANCPVTGGRGASAAADFAANKPIQVPRANGMTIGIIGSASTVGGITTSTRSLADKIGEEAHSLTESENGPHFHTFSVSNGVGSTQELNGTPNQAPTTQSTSVSGNGTPHNTMQPTTFVTWIVAL